MLFLWLLWHNALQFECQERVSVCGGGGSYIYTCVFVCVCVFCGCVSQFLFDTINVWTLCPQLQNSLLKLCGLDKVSNEMRI